MSDIKLSVIIPTYNAAKYIEQAVQSVISGLYGVPVEEKPVEILIMDDGSTDDTGALCDDIAERFRDEKCLIKVIHQENRGHGGAINAGVDVCEGRYFIILDADDTLSPDGLGVLLEKLSDDTSDMIICGEDRRHEDTREIEHYRMPAELTTGRKILQADLKFVTDNWNTGLRHLFTMHNMVFCTEFYRNLFLRLPEKVFYDDAYYYVVAAAFARSITFIDSVLYIYRLGGADQSVAVDNRVKRIDQHGKVIDAILNEYGKAERAGQAAFLYYRSRLSGVVTDYFVTALLRDRDRKQGRKNAKLMMDKIGGRDIPRLKRNYRVLFIMNLLHMGEKQFDRLIGRK